MARSRSSANSARRPIALTRKPWNRSRAAVLQKPFHKSLAFLHLGNVDVFIGLVGLLDGARAADDGGNADLLEQARFGAVGHRWGAVGASGGGRRMPGR